MQCAENLPAIVLIESSVVPADVGSSQYLHEREFLLGNIIKSVSPSSSSSSVHEKTILPDNIEAYVVSLETKYYSADLRICRCLSATISTQEFAESIEGVIFHFDAEDDADLVKTSRWLSFTQHWNPSIRLLVCGSIIADNKREVISEWCVKNCFELVELNPDEDAVAEAAEFGELLGTERIAQVIKSHAGWHNMKMKHRDDDRHLDRLREYLDREDAKDTQFLNDELQERDISSQAAEPASKRDLCFDDDFVPTSDQFSSKEQEFPVSSCTQLTSASQQVQSNKAINETDCAALAKLLVSKDLSSTSTASSETSAKAEALSSSAEMLPMDAFTLPLNDDAFKGSTEEPVDFEHLFDQLREMKLKADTLPEAQRKKYAEAVVIAFWKSIGGDESEIANLSSDDEI